jgi:hypothetical protein
LGRRTGGNDREDAGNAGRAGYPQKRQRLPGDRAAHARLERTIPPDAGAAFDTADAVTVPTFML